MDRHKLILVDRQGRQPQAGGDGGGWCCCGYRDCRANLADGGPTGLNILTTYASAEEAPQSRFGLVRLHIPKECDPLCRGRIGTTKALSSAWMAVKKEFLAAVVVEL